MASRGTRATAKDLAHRIFDFGAAGCPRFRRRMTELGYVEGKNLIVDARAAVGRYDPLPDWLTLRPAPEFCLTPRGNGSGERSRGAAARVHGPILDHRGKPISGHAAGFEPTSQARVDIRRHRRSAFKSVMAKRVKNTWYVSYRPRESISRGYSPRTAEAFPSEVEAKIFARSKLGKLRYLAAGTLNPHLPKRVIGPESMAEWLAES